MTCKFILSLLAFLALSAVAQARESCPLDSPEISALFGTKQVILSPNLSEAGLFALIDETQVSSLSFLKTAYDQYQVNGNWVEQNQPRFYEAFARTPKELRQLRHHRSDTAQACANAAFGVLVPALGTPALSDLSAVILKVSVMANLMCTEAAEREKLRKKIEESFTDFQEKLIQNRFTKSEKVLFVLWKLFPEVQKQIVEKRMTQVLKPAAEKLSRGEVLSGTEIVQVEASYSELKSVCRLITRERVKSVLFTVIGNVSAVAGIAGFIAVTNLFGVASILGLAGLSSQVVLEIGLIASTVSTGALAGGDFLLFRHVRQSFLISELSKTLYEIAHLQLFCADNLIFDLAKKMEPNWLARKKLILRLQQNPEYQSLYLREQQYSAYSYLKKKIIFSALSSTLFIPGAVLSLQSIVQTFQMIRAGDPALSSNVAAAVNYYLTQAGRNQAVNLTREGALISGYAASTNDGIRMAERLTSFQAIEAIRNIVAFITHRY